MDIVHMKTFAAVVEEESFTAAADRIGVAKSVCSRRVTELEAHLGVQLVNRTTRSVLPTDQGRDYYKDCVDILERLDAANMAVRGSTASVAGKLRLSLPLNYSESVLVPALDSYARSYPEVDLELSFSDQRVDLISSGFDAALRIGMLEDSTLYARKLGQTSIVCCAAPSYLAEHGTPETIEDLNGHECLMYTNVSARSEWSFVKDGKTIRKRVFGRLRSNSGVMNKQLAIRGLGIICVPDFTLGDSVEKGDLVPILTDYALPSIDIQIVYPHKKFMRASLRAFIDHLGKML